VKPLLFQPRKLNPSKVDIMKYIFIDCVTYDLAYLCDRRRNLVTVCVNVTEMMLRSVWPPQKSCVGLCDRDEAQFNVSIIENSQTNWQIVLLKDFYTMQIRMLCGQYCVTCPGKGIKIMRKIGKNILILM